MDEAQAFARAQRIETLLAAIQEHGNPIVRASAVELVRALLDLHRAGLAAMLDVLAEQGGPEHAIVAGLLKNDVVSQLLLLHGLHPVDLDTRLRQALERVSARLHAHGADVRLEQANPDGVRLRLTGDSPDVRTMLEQAILEAAPDVLHIEIIDGDARTARLSLPLLREAR